MKNDWTITPEYEIRKIKLSKRMQTLQDRHNMIKLLFFIFLFGIMSLFGSERWEIVQTPHMLKDYIIIHKIETGKTHHNSWVCPNPYCGFENFNEFGTCALCNTKRETCRDCVGLKDIE